MNLINSWKVILPISVIINHVFTFWTETTSFQHHQCSRYHILIILYNLLVCYKFSLWFSRFLLKQKLYSSLVNNWYFFLFQFEHVQIIIKKNFMTSKIGIYYLYKIKFIKISKLLYSLETGNKTIIRLILCSLQIWN